MDQDNASAWWGRVRTWRQGEWGMSEVASAIFILPFMFFLLFALVEAGIHFHYRGRVDTITQSTVQHIGQDGALKWSRTNTLPDGYSTWTAWGEAELAKLCGASTTDRCTAPPVMTCTVANSTSAAPDAVQVARFPGSEVRCAATYYYRPVSPLSANPVTSVGFSQMFNAPIRSTIYGSTTVGYEG